MSETKRDYISNLCKNALFPISAASFLSLNCVSKIAYIIGLVCIMCIAAYYSDVFKPFKSADKRAKIAAVLSAAGASFCCAMAYYTENIAVIDDMDSKKIGLLTAMTAALALLSPFSLSVPLAAFYTKAGDFAKKHLQEFERSDGILFAVVWAVLTVFTVFAFVSSHAFYGGDIPYDLIYTSDSPDIVGRGAYLWLRHPENDIRQPFFAVFSAPFLGIPYLISLPFWGIGFVQPILLAAVQTAMLLAAFFMISRLLHMDRLMRTAFVIFCSSAYTSLLFNIMMEQYIVGSFWLILFIFLVREEENRSVTAYIGAAGTLLTSAVLFPLLSDKNPVKCFKEWFRDMFGAALKLLLAFAVFGRADCILGLFTSVKKLGRFTGASVPLSQRLKQYTHFAANLFAAPEAGICRDTQNISWQLAEISDYSVMGIVLIILCIIGFIVSRKDKLSQISICWIGLSVLLLVIVGWGAAENGLILYSLYFGWAFFVLIYKLFSAVFERLGLTKLLPYFYMAAAAVMLVINVPEILRMISFAAEYYPA